MNIFDHIEDRPDFSRVKDDRLVKSTELDETFAWVSQTPKLFVDYEGTGTQPRKGHKAFACGFFAPDKGAKYVDFRYLGDKAGQMVGEALKKRTDQQTTIAFNNGTEHRMTKSLGGKLNGKLRDSMVDAYALREERPNHGKFGGNTQKALVFHELKKEPIFAHAVQSWLQTRFGSHYVEGSYDKLPAELIVPYCLEDVTTGYELFECLDKQIQANFQTALVETDAKLGVVIADLEDRGMCFDAEYAKALVDRYSDEMKVAYARVKAAIGRDIDVNSHDKLFGLIYGELKLPQHTDIVKSGKLDQDVFNWMLHLPQVAEWDKKGKLVRVVDQKCFDVLQGVLDVRETTKMLDTYLRPWLYEWAVRGTNTSNWLIHPNLNYIGPITRRFSAYDPNMQNVPKRTDRGGELRKCFITRPGFKTYSMDVMQAEYRSFAHYSRDAKLCDAYIRNRLTDIHEVVSQLMGVARKEGKHINFGILYGMGMEKLARKLNCTKEVAKMILDKYMRMFPGVATLRAECREFVKGKGYINDVFGGRVHLTTNESYKALNNRMQMTVANLMRRAMVRAAPIVEEVGGSELLQIHDDLLFELPGDDIQEHLPTLKRVRDEAMQNQPEFCVPFYSTTEVWAGETQNWGEAVPVEGM